MTTPEIRDAEGRVVAWYRTRQPPATCGSSMPAMRSWGPHTTRRLIECFLASPPPRAAALDAFADRELQVMSQVARLTNREVAARLDIGEASVKTHVARILTKLGLRGRVQAVVYARKHGIIRPGDNDPAPQ
jgi:DNA-binding NarL/FixJ family response regulator